jgi:pyrroloquinoline quinone biosynthesis protein D
MTGQAGMTAADSSTAADRVAVATPDTRPRVGAGFRLQWEPVQDCHVLLYPEGMVKLNPSAGEIMKRCDGQRSVTEIVADLEQAFGARGLQGDVLAFVDMAAAQGWLVWTR